MSNKNEETAPKEGVTVESPEVAQLKKENAELKAQVESLTQEKETMTLASITKVVDDAIADRRLEASKKEQFVELGKKVGIEELENVFAAMTVKEKASAVLRGGRAVTEGNSEWKTLRDVPADKIAELRTNDREEYARLYKATYGMEPTN